MDTIFFHPKNVHNPKALGVLKPLIAGGLLLSWWRGWLPARAWSVAVALQAALLVSGVVALQTGEAEEDRVEGVVAEQLIDEHEEAAEAFVWASGGALGLMLLGLFLSKSKAGLPMAGLGSLASLVVFGLGYQTGQAGGELVYRHGAASVHVSQEAGVATGTVELDRNRGDDDDDDDD
jgi:hypothetical protein